MNCRSRPHPCSSHPPLSFSRSLSLSLRLSSQLRIQHGVDLRYYSDLAHEIGCLPNFWRILTERPTAIWHAYFVFFGPIIQLTNRLVGPGRLENAEEWIEKAYESRHAGVYKEAGAGFDYNVSSRY